MGLQAQLLLSVKDEVYGRLANQKHIAIAETLMRKGAGTFSAASIERELFRLKQEQQNRNGACCEDTKLRTQHNLTVSHRKEIDSLVASQRATMSNMAVIHHNDMQNLTATHRGEMRKMVDTIRLGTKAAVDFAAAQIPTLSAAQTTAPRVSQVTQMYKGNLQSNDAAGQQADAAQLQPRAVGRPQRELG